MAHVIHSIEPIYNGRSRVLLLGTMPSETSRRMGYPYAHPTNRFWPVLALLLGEAVPQGAAQCRDFALRHGIAVWDVLHSCDIEGSADSSIKNPVPNPVWQLLEQAPVRTVFTTGGAAARLYRRHLEPRCGPARPLPSTSAANARMPLEKLAEHYAVILQYLD